MQTKLLNNCAEIKGIMIKLMLCVIAVLSLTMFIPQEVEACPDCTCAPWAEGRHPASGDWDARNECNGGQCEHNCGGHDYPYWLNPIATPWGLAAVFDYNEWVDPFFCHRVKYGHVHAESYCSRCNKVIVTDGTWIIAEWDEHNWQAHGDWYRHPWDPCQIWANNYYTCSGCGAVLDADDTFLFWDHNQGIHWKETDVNGDRTYHALYCNAHGWVNSDDCANHPQSSGSYAGLWNGVNTTSGTLKYYYHNLSPTNYGDSMHYKCTDCGHTHY